MPLVSTPSLGYPDWQRVENYDTPTLWTPSTAVRNTQIQSPIINVSRFAYLGGSLGVNTGPAQFFMQWFADAAGLVPLGNRLLVLAANMSPQAPIRFANLGPFVQLEYDPIGGANYAPSAVIVGTNRVHPLEFIPGGGPLIQVVNVPIAANGTSSPVPATYYAGPLRIYGFLSTGTGRVFVQNLDAGGTYRSVDEYNIVNNNEFAITMLAPAGAWNMAVTNSVAAAGTYHLTATPSMTGAL